MLEDDVAEALARLHALDPDDPNVTVDRDRTDMRRIGAALYAVDIAHTILVRAVADARHRGRSWTEIANVLGVSRQAARQRFGKEVAETAHQEIPDAAVQQLLDAGFSTREVEALTAQPGTPAVDDIEPVRTRRIPAARQRAVQGVVTTLPPDPDRSGDDTAGPGSGG
ncbi:hypothetical protein [Jatrophihabitans sp.]|uniref:hypothetical protein n=1 Tax=Jatrophihabitans sp. TaxID=1932789 RepID=UPI002C38F163|nr:hypothetical protein [Jatrophihabitans sp.]